VRPRGHGQLHLLRHGESVFNTRFHTDVDLFDLDSQLTDHGRAQAAAAAERVAAVDPDLVITSPLIRALQTAEIVAGDRFPVLVEPLVRERLSYCCDVGRTASELAAEFPRWRFDHVPERWWSSSPGGPGTFDAHNLIVESELAFRRRVVAFRAWLAGRPERRIVVVGHAAFFSGLCGLRLGNGQLIELRDAVRAAERGAGAGARE
jgi:broad specificity phosphatase PhoE